MSKHIHPPKDAIGIATRAQLLKDMQKEIDQILDKYEVESTCFIATGGSDEQLFMVKKLEGDLVKIAFCLTTVFMENPELLEMVIDMMKKKAKIEQLLENGHHYHGAKPVHE